MTTDWNAVSAFMANVIAWPTSPQDVGYVNLHYSTVNRKNPTGPLMKGMGWPFRSLDTLINRASWINTTSQFKDVWYCLSLQRETKPNTKDPTKPKAHRLAANALKLKAIWIDMDVGPGPKKYPTINDALKAAIEFREKYKLPPFSAIVGSGSGIHVYWISETALTTNEWSAYAEGLRVLILQEGMKCDAGLTTDAARILRVPGTFNHKTTPPKPVQLFNVPLVMYDFEQSIGFLRELAPEAAIAGSPTPTHSLFAEGANMASFQLPPQMQATAGDTLQAGIDKHGETLLDPAPIFKHCGFYRDALLTGGKDYDNALWMYSVLGATFMEKGDAIAHAVSKGHATYSAVDTQALYDRKVAERADRGIGYPSCAAIAGAGCGACKTCPLFGKGKSPLNLRPVTVTVNSLNMAAPAAQSNAGKLLSLPAGYDVDPEGYICSIDEVNIGGELQPPILKRLFLSKITDPWVQSTPDALNFTTTVDKGTTDSAYLLHEEMQGSLELSKTLGRRRVKTNPENKGRLEQFFVSWLAKLHEMAAAQKSLPFGWYKEGDDHRGFVYAGRLMKDDGGEQPCGVGDPKMRKIFHPSGDIDNWFKACKVITQQKRPELDAIIALSFAAPLTALVGKNAMTLCAYGDSGVGKSAAYAVGVSVWGQSKLGKQVSDSTFNSIMKAMGELTNLPLYWDEIKDPKAQEAVYHFLYNSSDGVEKARLKSDITQQDRGTWQTQMMMASNISFVDYVISKNANHIAGASRVLEYHVKVTPPNAVGKINNTDAEVIIDKLTTSYGNMGLLYGKLLAMNHAAIKQECVDSCNQVEADMTAQDAERFWTAQVGTLLVGARLANTLGCDLDVPALKTFLYRVYLENRAKRDMLLSVTGHKDSTEGVMSDYFSKTNTMDQALWVTGTPATAGRPMISIVHQPKDTKNVSVTTGVAVRWDVSARKVYILKGHLVAFLDEAGKQVGSTLASLTKDYGMEVVKRVSLGAGTQFNPGLRQACCVMEIAPGHEWEDQLYAWSGADRPPPDAPPTQPTVETGLTSPEDVVAFVKGAVRA